MARQKKKRTAIHESTHCLKVCFLAPVFDARKFASVPRTRGLELLKDDTCVSRNISFESLTLHFVCPFELGKIAWNLGLIGKPTFTEETFILGQLFGSIV